MQAPRSHADGIYWPEELKEIEVEVAAGSVPGETEADVQERAARTLDKRRLIKKHPLG